MQLREYLFKHRIKVADFARKIKYARAYVNTIVLGKKPGRRLAEEIQKATNGEVTADELLKDNEEIDKE